MNYKLINYTKTPNELLHKIIQFVFPSGLNNVKIILRYCRFNSDQFEGTAYSDSNRVSLKISRRLELPFCCGEKSQNKFGYIDMSILKTREEAIISLCAHELRHLWQNTVSKQDFTKTRLHKFTVGNKKHECLYKMEKDASIYARKMLLKWRKYKKYDKNSKY